MPARQHNDLETIWAYGGQRRPHDDGPGVGVRAGRGEQDQRQHHSDRGTVTAPGQPGAGRAGHAVPPIVNWATTPAWSDSHSSLCGGGQGGITL